jgi:hypothetical protein
VILFNECDHLWRENTGTILEAGIKELGLVSGYDHPDLYTRYDIHLKETEIKIVDNYHFRKSLRNVMTWGIRNDVFKKTADIWKKYGYLDDENWKEARTRDVGLWTALPALETHMVKAFMAPGVDWSKYYGG